MRANGVAERFCTGNATPREKFDAWIATVPHTLRNPLYHWSHLELARYFGINDLITPASAEKIWREANAKLPSLRVHDILAANKVAAICTTDDPADPLDQHQKIKQLGLKTRVYPTFRPDKALIVHEPAAFNAWIEKLAGVAKATVKSFEDFLGALQQRHGDFHEVGCRLSDHGMEACYAEPCTALEAKTIFDAARAGRAASAADQAKFATFLMRSLVAGMPAAAGPSNFTSAPCGTTTRAC